MDCSIRVIFISFKLQGKDAVNVEAGVRTDFPTTCPSFP